MLQEIEARGGPASIREILHVLVMPVIEFADDERSRGYIRFTSLSAGFRPEEPCGRR